MRAIFVFLILAATLLAGSASAYDPNDPANCNGVEWDDNDALVVAKVTASPRVNFVKSPYDDELKADGCPAATEACRKRSYLVAGDLVLAGRTHGTFTCVSYQTPKPHNKPHRRPIWTTGWLPSAVLKPVAPMAAPRPADWLGTWDQPHATIEIKPGGLGGRLRIEGVAVYPTAQDVHNGTIDAQVMPAGDSITFLDDGWFPFETKCDTGCRVRMRRVGPWLVVEDNGDCGGAGVTFTGLYHRK
jgi:hypothetical protein